MANLYEWEQNDDDSLYNCDITYNELITALSQTNNTSPGEDNISNIMLRHLQPSHMTELLSVFNQSFKTGIFPRLWKTGLVVPILKPGKDKHSVASYRPITLLSCVGKLLERIIKRRLEYVIEAKKVLPNIMCGFRRGIGTIDVLLRIENSIRQALNAKQICVVVYIDLKSAFDTVRGDGVIFKLKRCGVQGNLLKWLHNYSKDRSIKTIIEGALSDEFDQIAGTPQGAILSPLLFNLMMIDIPQDDNVEIFLYDDDITVICTSEESEDVRIKMQAYLNKFQEWTEEWGLIINPVKTVVQHYTKKRIPCPSIRLRNQALQYKKEQKLLGLVMDSPNLTFKSHIKYLKKDCMKRIDILKSFSSIKHGATIKVLRNFYVAYIRSKIDYGAIVYGGASPSNLKKLDSVQNACLRIILGARKSSPELSLQAETYIPPLDLHRIFLLSKQNIVLNCKPRTDGTANHILGGPFPSRSFMERSDKSLSFFNMPIIKRTPETTEQFEPWNCFANLIKIEYEEDVHCLQQ